MKQQDFQCLSTVIVPYLQNNDFGLLFRLLLTSTVASLLDIDRLIVCKCIRCRGGVEVVDITTFSQGRQSIMHYVG